MPFIVPALAAIGGGSALAGGLAVAGTAAGIYGATKTANATKTAANTAATAATTATNQNNQLQTNVFNSNAANLNPSVQNGLGYNDKINQFLATNPFKYEIGDYQKSPGYDFRLKQGMDGVTQNAAVNGSRLSGGTLKALNEYGQGFASNDYNNWFNREQVSNTARNNNALSYLGQLTGQQQTGVNAASALAGVGQNYANNVGQNNMFNANQVGNAALVGANNTNALFGNIANTAGNLFQGSRSSFQPGYIPATTRGVY